MDQVTLIGPEDAGSLRFHMECTKRFNPLVERTFYIYAECPAVIEAIKKCEGEKCLFIPESELLTPKVCANKWIYQQLLKLSVDSLHGTHNLSELFLFTDVDTLALREVKEELLFRDGDPIHYMRSSHVAPVLCRDYVAAGPVEEKTPFADWHYTMTCSVKELLGLKDAEHLSAVNACVVWSQRTMRRLKRYIEQINQLPWQEAIVNTWIRFLCKHQKNFFRSAGFRDIEFNSSCEVDLQHVIGIEELQSHVRLGFSEWQLYSYYITHFEKASKRWLGLLGKEAGPCVAEFNTVASDKALLQKILEKQSATPFLYFYPNLQGCEEVLSNYLQ